MRPYDVSRPGPVHSAIGMFEMLTGRSVRRVAAKRRACQYHRYTQVPDSGQPPDESKMLVLLVEPTSEARATFERSLREAGYDTIAASSPRKAMPLMIDTAVDAVVCRMNGRQSDPLICWIASHKPSVPVIVTGPTDESFQTKFADATNLERLEDADTDRIVSVLGQIGPRKGFFGSAIEIELFDYVQMIALTGRDKVIQIETPQGAATVWFEHGDVVHVEYGEFRGEMAFYKVLSDSRGLFSEVYWRNPPRRTVTRSSTHLLMEAARQSDEGTLGHDAQPVDEDPETSFADLTMESTQIPVDDDRAANDPRSNERSAGAKARAPASEEPAARRAGTGETPSADNEDAPSEQKAPEPKRKPTGEQPAAAASRKRATGEVPVPSSTAGRESRNEAADDEDDDELPPVVRQPKSAPLRPMASDNEDEDFAALVEDSLSEQLQEVEQGALDASDQFKLRNGEHTAAADSMVAEWPLLDLDQQAAMSTAAGHAILDDPDTRAVMLEQFWQFEGINGVAIISSTGKVLAEDMRNNSSLVTLAGFYMRGAARIARALGHNVFDGVVARSVSGQKMVMVGMGAASAVLSVEADADPEQVRDAVMGVD
jgi:hypothetical protein